MAWKYIAPDSIVPLYVSLEITVVTIRTPSHLGKGRNICSENNVESSALNSC